MLLSAHFTDTEMACKCGCNTCDMNENFMKKLEDLRVWLDFPLVITSGFRCLNHPAESLKNKGGMHTHGRAVDVACTDPYKRYQILSNAGKFGMKGIGISANFIHLDDSSERTAVWLY